jgi:hypothetical protein
MQATTPPTPGITLAQLRHVRGEITAARQELIEMIAIADFRAMWNEPRKYFVPEIGSRIPFPNGHLSRLRKLAWRDADAEDAVWGAIVNDIFDNLNVMERAREEFLRQRFKKEEPDPERYSSYW